MATHGFIEVKFKEDGIEERILIHAVHDGYFSDMIEDILTLPIFIAHLLKKEFIINEEIPEFLKNSNYSHRNHIYEMFCINQTRINTYEDLLNLWGVIIPLDETKYTFPSYLINKRPDKYQIVTEPFILYGHPVENADILMEFSDNRLCGIIISFERDVIDPDSDEEMEYLELIENINNYLTEEDAKIKILPDNKIYMNIDKMIVDLYFHKKI